MIIGKYLFRIAKKLSRENLGEFLHLNLSNLPKNISILNVGSGGVIEGQIKSLIANKNIDYKSLDISPDRKPDIIMDICEAKFDNAYDIVIMSEVLEHIPTPHLAIESVLRALKPGGVLLLSVPFIFPLHDRPYDFFRFTRYGIAYLLREFDEFEIQERNGWAETFLVLAVRLLNQKKGKPYFEACIVVCAFLLLPIARILTKMIKTDFITSGYTVKALKSRESLS